MITPDNITDTSFRKREQLKKFHSKRNIDASKSLISIIIVLCVIWLGFTIYMQITALIISTFSFLMLISLSYVLHLWNRHITARVLFFISCNLLMFFGGQVMGTAGNVDLIMISGIGLIFLVFNYSSERKWILFCFSLVIANILWLWISEHYRIEKLATVPAEHIEFISLMSLLTALTVLIIVLAKSMNVFSRFENTVFDLVDARIQLSETEKMAALGQLTAGVAHELNNPINVINASIVGVERNLIKAYDLLDEYQKVEVTSKDEKTLKRIEKLSKDVNSLETRKLVFDVIDDVKIGSKRTTHIVSSLQKFSRLENEEKKAQDLHASIEETLMLLRTAINPKIKIVKLFDPSIDTINCYGYELNQVIMNLIINAKQALDGEGTITIITENLGDSISIVVKDDGCGMSEETKKNIFTPFFTTKPIGKGTGLGLSVSYGIIEKHGGAIHVKSKPGSGSEFIINLPKSA